MNPEIAIRPNLQFSVLCDDVRREDNGKLILLGLFEVIGAPKFPAVHARLFVVNRWCKGEGEFVQKIKVVHAVDNRMLIETKPQRFTLKDIDSSYTVISEFNSVTFPAAGKYWIEVNLDGDLMLNYPVMLAERPRR